MNPNLHLYNMFSRYYLPIIQPLQFNTYNKKYLEPVFNDL